MPAQARRLLLLLAALTTLLVAGCASVAATPGPHGLGSQNRVWAPNLGGPSLASPIAAQSPCLRPDLSASAAGVASGFCVAAEDTAAATAVGGENSAAALGRYVHGLAKASPESFYGPGSYDTEVSLFNAEGRVIGRADAISYETRTVYELKPNNPRALAAGQRQANGYAQLLSEQTGEPYTGQVVPYNPGSYQIPPGG